MIRMYIGTYTARHGGEGEGIYIADYDVANGTVNNIRLAVEAPNPTFLALHPSNTYLYSVTEIGQAENSRLAGVSAYAIEGGSLRLLNKQETGGLSSCHVSVDKTGRQVLVANYGGGSVSVHPIQKDGSLAAYSCHVQHEGSSVNAARQEGPHAHSINLDHDNRFAFVCDLGTDDTFIYAFDADAGTLMPAEQASVKAPAGAGPRHFAMHPNGRFAYVINELDGTMSVYAYDASSGSLTELQTCSTLPDDYTGENSCADVHVSPCGRFLFGSNRFQDSIVSYRIDENLGTLSLVGWEPTHGKTPRNIALSPDGQYLLVENQDSHTIVTMKINQETGELSATGDVAEVPSPVCAIFEVGEC